MRSSLRDSGRNKEVGGATRLKAARDTASLPLQAEVFELCRHSAGLPAKFHMPGHKVVAGLSLFDPDSSKAAAHRVTSQAATLQRNEARTLTKLPGHLVDQ